MILQRGLPFSVKIPNGVTKQALEHTRARRNIESLTTLISKDLGI